MDTITISLFNTHLLRETSHCAENDVKFLFMIAASVKSIMESTEKLCGGKVKLKVIKAYAYKLTACTH